MQDINSHFLWNDTHHENPFYHWTLITCNKFKIVQMVRLVTGAKAYTCFTVPTLLLKPHLKSLDNHYINKHTYSSWWWRFEKSPFHIYQYIGITKCPENMDYNLYRIKNFYNPELSDNRKFHHKIFYSTFILYCFQFSGILNDWLCCNVCFFILFRNDRWSLICHILL